jgi:prepilin-type N-terminal cleavage/methylation domain-containing protein
MSGRRGFSLIEIMVSIVILSFGILAMAASSGFITRTLTGSRMATVAAQVATQRLDRLRALAASTTPPCTAGGFASSAAAVVTQRVTETWIVPASGTPRTVQSIVAYQVGAGRMRTDTMATTIMCN